MGGKRHLKQGEHAAHLAEALCRPGEKNTATPHRSAEQATGRSRRAEEPGCAASRLQTQQSATGPQARGPVDPNPL